VPVRAGVVRLKREVKTRMFEGFGPFWANTPPELALFLKICLKSGQRPLLLQRSHLPCQNENAPHIQSVPERCTPPPQT